MSNSRNVVLSGSAVRVIRRLFLALLCYAALGAALAANPLSEQYANLRIRGEEAQFLLRSERISQDEYRQRSAALAAESRQLTTLVRALPRELQQQVRQESESLFQVRIVPLREQWQQALREKQKTTAANNAAITQQLQADAVQAAELQAGRTLLRERQQRGEVATGDAAIQDQAAERNVLALQSKYDGLGGSWGRNFSQAVARETSRLLAQGRQQDQQRQQKEQQQVAARDRAAAQADAQATARQQIEAAAQAQAATRAKAGASAAAVAKANLRPSLTATGGSVTAPATTALATGARPLPPLPGVQPPARLPEPSGTPWLAWLLGGGLLSVVGGGAYAYRRRNAAPVKARYRQATLPAASQATPSAPALSARAQPAESTVLPAGASVKDRLFAEQRAKYQALYTDAVDRMTAAGAELAQMAPLLTTLQGNLTLLSKTVVARLRALIAAQSANTLKLLMYAAIFMPVWRLLRRGGWLLKIGIVLVAVTLLGSAANLLQHGDGGVLVILYALLVIAFFFLERFLRLRDTNTLLKQNADALKDMKLAWLYESQRPHATADGSALHGIRVSAVADIGGLVSDVVLPQAGTQPLTPGTVLLAVDGLATYRLQPDGKTALASPGNNEFMRAHGSLLQQALDEQRAFAAESLPALRQYGEVAWRRRQAADEVPRLEALVNEVKRLEQLWQDTWVADPVFEFLLRRIDLFNVRDPATPAGILLHGYPGNGKAHLAQKIAASVSARFETVSLSTLASADDVQALWAAQRGKGPVLLFVDQAEQAFARPGSPHAGAGSREGALAWVEEWSRQEPRESGVWVVLSTQQEGELHPAVLGALGGSRIEVGPPDAAGRALVMQAACRENKLPAGAPDWLIAGTSGCSIRELRDVVKEARLQSVPQPPTDVHWREALKTVRGAEGFDDKSKTWDRLILPSAIKEQLIGACKALQDAERYRKKNAPIPNLLLYGPPGTGKTEVARTLANEAGVKFFERKVSDLKAGFIGQSAPLIKEMFAKARAAAPAVLFLDEIDAVAAKRGSANADSFSRDIVNEMLAQMDGAKQNDRPVFVLAATNFLEHIDDAIKSRFTELIEIPLPDLNGRTQILQGLIGDRDLEPGLDVAEVSATLAQRLPNKSGRDLKKLVERAMSRAMRTTGEHLTRELLLSEAAPRGREVPEEELQRVWSKIVLKAELKDALLAKIRLFNSAGAAAPRGLLLYGPPGTGKTQIAKRIAESCGGKFIGLTASDLKGSVIGETAKRVKEVWEKARAHGRCVMFIDECEGVFARRGGVNTDSYAEELVREFIALWDGVGSEGQIWVVGATNRREDLDPAVISRFGTAVEIGLPDAAERVRILGLELQTLGREDPVPEFVGRATTGLAGRDLAQLSRDVYGAAVESNSPELTPAIWREAIARRAAAGSDAADDSARWNTLVLADDTLQQLKTVCEGMRHMESLRQQGIEPPRGALLFGPPGTGKTQIARTLANEAGVGFISAAPSDVKAGYIGQSGLKLRELFERARAQAPSILFIDEIDAVASVRGGDNGVTNDEVVNEMLAQMDGVKKASRPVFVLAATNHPERIDAAIKSRFTYQIEVPNPDRQQRERLLGIFLSGKRQVDFDVAKLAAELAARTDGLGGRALQSLVRRAEQRAVQRALAAGTPEQVVLSRADIDAQMAPQGKAILEADLQAQWDQVVLKPNVKDSILGKLRMFNRADKAAPKGLLLYGPPGTGKTEIARRMAATSGSRFLALTGADLKGDHIGQTAQKVKAVWNQARASGRCILFVDECEGVFARRGGTSTDSYAEELVREFIAAWDGMASGGQVWVVGATNRLDQLDDAVLSRFGDPVEIGLPDAAERQQILQLEMAKLGRDDAVPDFVGREATGLSGRALSRLAHDVITLAAERNGGSTPALWREVLARSAKAGSHATDASARWETLILPEPTLRTLKRMAESLRHVETLRKQGIEPARGALLYGPPGTGKTQIARTLANESGLAFIAAGPSDIKAGFVGQSGQKVRELFERARAKAPSILFIDEIDSGAAARGGPKSDVYTDEIVVELLAQMDGVKKISQHVFVLAACNHADAIDPAVLSRFEERIAIDNPGLDERRRLLTSLLKRQRTDFDVDDAAGLLAPRLEGMSGRDLQSVVRRASREAVQRAFDAGTPENVVLSRDDLLAQLPSGNT